MSEFLQRITEKLIDWKIRERHIERYLICGGVLCVSPIIGRQFSVNIAGHDLTLNFLPSLPDFLLWMMLIIGLFLFVLAATIAFIRVRKESTDSERRRVFVIEQRGLRDTTDAPLLAAIPNNLIGRRESILIDIRERIRDGFVTDPERALERVVGLSSELELRRAGHAAVDISTAYGGLSPVPFTFLAGLLVDDESSITIFDWDRDALAWRPLDGIDDGGSFSIAGIDSITTGTAEVAMAISVSYGVDIMSVSKILPNAPLVELQLIPRTNNGHWSENKQRRLASEFLNSAIQIADAGVQVIHLFIAAPNSMVFRFGQTYDKRNLPRVFVYQYQKGCDIEHPWSVSMPVQGVKNSRLVHTTIPI